MGASERAVAPHASASELVALVGRARSNDQVAWEELVDRLGGLVWSVTRSFEMNVDDAVDVGQTVWLRLAEKLDDIRDPARIGAWLMVTARNECQRLSNSKQLNQRVGTAAERARLVDEEFQNRPDERFLAKQRERALTEAIEELTEPCRTLIRLCLVDPPLQYDELAVLMDVPPGTIGPRRRRCLRRLEHSLGPMFDEEDGSDA